MAKVKEVRTLFTLDAQKFTSELKNIDKIVNNLNKEIAKTNKDTKALDKEFKALSKTLKTLEKDFSAFGKVNTDMKDMLKLTKNLTAEFKRVQSELKYVGSQAKETKKSFKEMTNIDLRSLGKLKSLVESVRDTKLFNDKDFNSALRKVDRIKKELSNVKVNIDITDLQSQLNRLSVKLNVTGSGGGALGSGNTANDIERALKNITTLLARNVGQAAYGGGDSGGGQGAIGNAMESFRTYAAFKTLQTDKNLNKAIVELTGAAKGVAGAANQIEGSAIALDDAGDSIYEAARQLEKAIRRMDRESNFVSTRSPEDVLDQRRRANRQGGYSSGGGLGGSMGFAQGGGGGSLGGKLGGELTEMAGGMAESIPLVGRLSGVLARLGPVGMGVAAAITVISAALAPMVAGMVKAVQASSEFQDAISKFTAVTGDAAGSAQQFGDELKNSFGRQGYTSDIAAFADSLTYVHRNLKLVGEEATAMNNKLQAVVKVTGYETTEVIRTQQRLMQNMGVDASTALDMVMGAYRETGDLNQDLLDTFGEYSSQLSKMGVSADYFYTALVKGSQSGVMNLDKVGDVLKELNLRLADPSDQKMLEALNKLGLSYKSLTSDLQKGGKDAESALNSIFKAVGEVQDKATQQNIVTALLGGPGEDAGTAFFQLMGDAEATVDSFTGSVNEAQAAIENTWSYQMTQLSNSFKTFFEVAGEQTLPFVTQLAKDLNGEMEGIQTTIETSLSPAFLNLAESIAYALGLDKPNDFADMIVDMINWVSKLINTFAILVTGLGKVGAAVQIIWNAIQMMVGGIAYMVDGVFYGMLGGIEGAIRQIVNWASGLVNGFVDAYNSSLGKVPGVGNLDHVNWKSDAWGKDNYWLGVNTSTRNQIFDGFKTDWGDMKSAFNRLISSPQDFQPTNTSRNRNNGTQSGGNGYKQPTIPTTAPNTGKYAGTNPTDADAKAAADAAKEAQRAAEEAAKAGSQAFEELTRSQMDYFNQLLELQESNRLSIIDFNTSMKEQEWQLMDTKDALKDQIKYWDELQKNLILTADEYVTYVQNEREAAMQLRDDILEDADALYDDMVESRKKALDDELKAVETSHKKEAEMYDSLIKDLDRKLDDLNRSWTDEDNADELGKLRAEYAKYENSTSAAGVAKRKELAEQIAEMEKEINRTAQQNSLEQQKQNLEDAADARDKYYTDEEAALQEKYDNVENEVVSREQFIADFREGIMDTTNEAIKGSLEDLYTQYVDVYKKIEGATLSHSEYQNAIILQAQRDWAVAQMNGDTNGMTIAHDTAEAARKAGGTIMNDGNGPDPFGGQKHPNPDYNTFKQRGAEWWALQEQIAETGDPGGKLKAKQKALNDANNLLRKKYGVGTDEDIPQFILHTGGIVPGSGEVTGKLMGGEAVFTAQQFEKLTAFVDRFSSAGGINSSFANAPGGVTNNVTNINFGGVTNNSNADFQKMVQQINSATIIKSRSTGTRNI